MLLFIASKTLNRPPWHPWIWLLWDGGSSLSDIPVDDGAMKKTTSKRLLNQALRPHVDLPLLRFSLNVCSDLPENFHTQKCYSVEYEQATEAYDVLLITASSF